MSMSHPLRALVAVIATATLAFAGTAEARTHHHRHHRAAAPTKQVCHHHHCHAVKVATTPTPHRVCRHHHCRMVTTATTTRRVCHHHHCHTVKAATSPAHARRHGAAAQPGNNGTCKSVRIHGQWVQRCNFPAGQ